ncbi:MAG: hypothetical protein R8G66_17550 [Cytophagales bacterium]|nr:hypothetical protein [Cytophagales bacterium]
MKQFQNIKRLSFLFVLGIAIFSCTPDFAEGLETNTREVCMQRTGNNTGGTDRSNFCPMADGVVSGPTSGDVTESENDGINGPN